MYPKCCQNSGRGKRFSVLYIRPDRLWEQHTLLLHGQRSLPTLPGVKATGNIFIIHLHLVPSLRISGDTCLLSPCALVPWRVYEYHFTLSAARCFGIFFAQHWNVSILVSHNTAVHLFSYLKPSFVISRFCNSVTSICICSGIWLVPE